jgi:hypothetical protein
VLSEGARKGLRHELRILGYETLSRNIFNYRGYTLLLPRNKNNTTMSKLEINDYRITKEEFESMSMLEKRNYILQEQQKETNWWLAHFAKIHVITFYIGLGILALYILFQSSK